MCYFDTIKLKCKKKTRLLFFRYTYGKPVKGDVTLTFLPLSFWGVKKNITKIFKVTFTDITSNGEKL